MIRRYCLQPITCHDSELEFEWDPSTGEVCGNHADKVRALCSQAVTVGSVTGHPHPTTFSVTDPLHRPGEMAVVLGQYWQLDGELQESYPVAPAEIPDNGDDEFDVVYAPPNQ